MARGCRLGRLVSARFALLAPFVVACGNAASGPATTAPPTSEDGGAAGSSSSSEAGSGPLPNALPPTVVIDAPADGSVLDAEQASVTGTASDDSGLASVFVQVGPNTPRLATSDDGFAAWRFDSPIPFGSFEVRAVAYDLGGLESEPFSVRVTRSGAPSDERAPTVTIAQPKDGSTPHSLVPLVLGSAEDDVAVVRMELWRNGELQTERNIETDDFFGRWARSSPLLPGQDNELTFVAYDDAGHHGEATLHLAGPVEVDRDPPELRLDNPEDGEKLDTDRLSIEGSAYDRIGVREVKVRLASLASPGSAPRWGAYVAAETSDGFAHFRAPVPLPSGVVRIEAKAIDVHGLSTSKTLDVQNDFVAEWGDERVMPLRLRDAEPQTELTMSLDKPGTDEVIAPDIQKDILLLELNPDKLFENTLNEVKVACGTDWQKDAQDPHHDCGVTELGRTFKGPDNTWRTSAEYSMVRILTMTPANVVVDGTSIEGLKNIADGAILGIKIGGGFNQILAEGLGIPRTREIIPTPALVKGLRERWLASHPAVGAGGTLPIMLYDALHDLTPLAERFGPAGGHPGIIDPAAPPYGVVFNDDFRLNITALSNLRWLDGVELARGKDYMATVVDRTGPTYDDVLEFDFKDPTRFEVLGLVDAPVVDMRMRVLEDPKFVPSCNGNDACQKNLPNAPLDANSVWATPRWETEHVLAYAGWVQYKTRVFDKCYVDFLGCLARVSLGQGGAPPGWTHFGIVFNLGNPPKDQYAWEEIGEIAQGALHRLPSGKIAEGDANPAFTLQDIPVGMTAEEIRTAIRPYLQDQSAKISDRLLGDYSKNNGQVDFFYGRGLDGVPYVFFVAAGDPRPNAGYDYQHPGFFSEPSLSEDSRVSRDSIDGSGDTTHQKLALSAGETLVYAEDEAGGLYRLKFEVPADNATEISVRVSRHR